MLECAVIGAAVVVWLFALVLHRRRTDRRVRMLRQLIGHRVTLGVAIRGSGRFIVPVIARIASVDRAHEWLFVEVIGVDLTADSNYSAQAPDSYLFEIAESGIPLGLVRSIEVNEARLRW